VPGDIVELAAGDLVPADGIVLASHAAHTNESLLTGEPYPVEKRPGPCSAKYPAEAYNALFGGTAMVSGGATMLVVATGAGTRFGGIAAALQSDRPPTPFERLGAMDVLCTDKTGTLTEARITLVDHQGSDGVERPRVLELAAINARFETGIRSPLDDAILDHARELKLPDWRRIADVPFDFERRRVSVLAERDGARSLIVKGAPEQIIERGTAVEAADGSVRPLEDRGSRQAASPLPCGGPCAPPRATRSPS